LLNTAIKLTCCACYAVNTLQMYEEVEKVEQKGEPAEGELVDDALEKLRQKFMATLNNSSADEPKAKS
jgi:hypothetical protein